MIRFAGFVVVVLALLVTARPAGATDGRQSPDPVVVPGEVATSSEAFALDVGNGVSCAGTGAEGWRVQTFVVDSRVNPADLDFQGAGRPSGWIGTDFDSSDGTLAAPLFKASGAAVNIIPALRPPGQINPSVLAGFTFDPSTWSLGPGDYRIGFACTGPTNQIRQWWVTTVSISTSTPPFIPAPPGVGDPPATIGSTASNEAPTAPARRAASTTTSTVRATTTTGVGAAAAPAAGPAEGDAAAASAPATADASGIAWWQFAALPAALVVALLAFLLVRAARHRHLRTISTVRYPKGTSP